MGIDINGARFLLWSRKQGVDFSSTVTLGRQSINLRWAQLRDAVKRMSMDGQVSLSTLERAVQGVHAEEFLECLGAKRVDSVDASAYEGATIIHDMNLAGLADGEYSCLVDGGTLEHVFNVRASFENCMNLVRVGGHIVHMLPANNFFGHGFFQFSAEFFYRLYGKENGFLVKKVLLGEECPGGKWLEVANPSLVKRRVLFSNALPTSVYVLIQKISDSAGMVKLPQQSDYEDLNWVGQEEGTLSRSAGLRNFVRNTLPASLGRSLLICRHLVGSKRDLHPFDFNA